MIVKTRFLGDIQYDDKEIICFEEGIPGFEDLKDYALINPDNDTVFSYMQSLERQDICFVLLSPFILIPDYDIEISSITVDKLNIDKVEDLLIYCIVTIPQNMQDTTVNLKAPIIINSQNRKAVQEILDTDQYSIRHKLIKEADV